MDSDPPKSEKFSICLFALTGFGNPVLELLVENSLAPDIVITKEEKGCYPYHKEEYLYAMAKRLGVPVFFDEEGRSKVLANRFDLLITASYHRKLDDSILSRATNAINIHPSLLPKYRGASPCFWQIKNGEKTTGVTAHRMTQTFDAGDILVQADAPISKKDTQGSLRQKLALLGGKVALQATNALKNKTAKWQSQIDDEATYAPLVTDDIYRLDPNQTIAGFCNHLKAATPYPGGFLKDGLLVTEIVTTRKTAKAETRQPVGSVTEIGNALYVLSVKDGEVTFKSSGYREMV